MTSCPMDFQVKRDLKLPGFEALSLALSFWISASQDTTEPVSEGECSTIDARNTIDNLTTEQQSVMLKFLNILMNSRTMGLPATRRAV
eukprot:CAMPEP_0184524024 /NCGR_PEP_ID=MMETSP0198_2-20121128/9251_1 /TAXON_ID=1112570 /ORGANISM="Thraustochytrium sp., Strain LLF1b" /LENGTH=87 /DNA_ID=CAMNT_0026915203 /DNA_START=29 /DNA_END=288 /DNA_ORIENTATION=+